MSHTRCRDAALLAGLFLCLAATGCGYSMKPLLREDIKTVYVPVFDNQTFRRFHEATLTQAVVDEIKQKTHLRIVPKGSADSILTGEITDIRPTVLVEDAENEALLTQFVVYGNFQWIDQRNGRMIAKADNLSASTIRRVSRGEPENEALRRAFKELARRIVQHMEKDW
ncbi:MAG TPA: LptE family protein [Candidatus Brocadiia bacterium]|nr:LptE family protein [Candidatus Brocadiia bacterium]